MLKTLCIFCASSSRIDREYFDVAFQLADVCSDNHIHVLYGGGAVGLMGALADRVIEKKGRITGIIPGFMKELEWAHEEVSEMIVVEDMRERKKRMIENVDAVVALPGGVGTLEELLEVITLKQLGRFHKPIVIINTKGFYNSLMTLFDEMIEKQFMHDLNRQIWTVIDSPLQLLQAIENARQWDARSINKGRL
jgi:TIGR00730 family protein